MAEDENLWGYERVWKLSEYYSHIGEFHMRSVMQLKKIKSGNYKSLAGFERTLIPHIGRKVVYDEKDAYKLAQDRDKPRLAFYYVISDDGSIVRQDYYCIPTASPFIPEPIELFASTHMFVIDREGEE